MDTYLLYGIALACLAGSALGSRDKTKTALKKAWKAFENILPQFLIIVLLIGAALALLKPEQISKVIGADSGIIGVVLAALVGSITLIPPYIAFPTAALLLDAGAGIVQIAAFVSTLMMVGIVTLPMEIRYFGRKTAVLRNLAAFFFSFLVAVLLGLIVRR